MVETTLFPRPYFTSFLQSNDNVDSLSYYEYQRLQRLQKVARLQERRSKSYEPGYKKPLVQVQPCAVRVEPHVTSGVSRQIFTKPVLKHSTINSPEQSKDVIIPPLKKSASIAAKPSQTTSFSETKKQQEERFSVLPIPASRKQEVEEEACVAEERKERVELKHTQTERLPRTVGSKFSRPVKSATIQGIQRAFSKPRLLPRPKSAAVGTRDVGTSTLTDAVNFQIPRKRDEEKKEDEPSGEVTKVVDLDGDDTPMVKPSSLAERIKEDMAQAYHWSTSTQRSYNEVNWVDRTAPVIPPPVSTVEQFPDPVSQRLTFRRYNSSPEPWQVYGPEWDCVQTRFGDYQPQGPVNFCAPTRHKQYIPGYTGCVPGSGEVDHPFLSRLLVRRLTPRPTRISKEIPLEEDLSPFRRTSPMSKTVTLVSPYNSFNKIEY